MLGRPGVPSARRCPPLPAGGAAGARRLRQGRGRGGSARGQRRPRPSLPPASSPRPHPSACLPCWSRRAPPLLFTWGLPCRRDSAAALPPTADRDPARQKGAGRCCRRRAGRDGQVGTGRSGRAAHLRGRRERDGRAGLCRPGRRKGRTWSGRLASRPPPSDPRCRRSDRVFPTGSSRPCVVSGCSRDPRGSLAGSSRRDSPPGCATSGKNPGLPRSSEGDGV